MQGRRRERNQVWGTNRRWASKGGDGDRDDGTWWEKAVHLGEDVSMQQVFDKLNYKHRHNIQVEIFGVQLLILKPRQGIA